MRTLIIDDQAYARTALREVLETHHPAVEIVGEAADVREGLRKIRALRPALVFLDVEMPDGTGFDLAKQLPTEERPLIIMFTAMSEYGADAYAIDAVHYLKKPLEESRLAEALHRVKLRQEQERSMKRLATVERENAALNYRTATLAIPGERETERIPFGDIIYCKGQSGYTRFYLKDGTTRLSAYSIGQFSRQMPEPPFKAVHRSYIVHLAYVAADPKARKLRLTNGDYVPVSPSRMSDVKAWVANR